MMKRMSNARFLIAILVFIFLMPGCGKSESDSLLKHITDGETSDIESIECEPYLASFIDTKLPEGEAVSHISVSMDAKHLCESTYSRHIYIYDTISWERKTVVSCEDEEYIIGLSAGEDGLSSLVTDNKSTLRIDKFDYNGDAISTINLNNVVEFKDFTIEKLLCGLSGNYYIKSAEAVITIGADGQLLGKVSLGDMYISDISVGRSGEVYVLGTAPAKGCFLYRIDSNYNSVTYIDEIAGNGSLYTGLEGELAYADNRYLYDYDPAQKETVICELTDNYINPQKVCTIGGFSREEFLVCSWNRFGEDDSKTPQCYSLRRMTDDEKKAAANREKEIIKVYKTGIAYNLPDLIFAFQKEYPQYEVVLEESDAALEDVEGFTNMKLLTGDSPDLIMIDLDNYDTYRDAGVLADLSSFVEMSDCFNESDFIKQILDPFREEETIYALPLSFSVHTLVGNGKVRDIQRKTIFESYDGCTTDGFISYLKKNPDVYFQFDGNPFGILRTMLKCEMEQFVDSNTSTCSFDGSEFTDLVMSTYGMNFETDFFDPDEWKECAKREKVIAEEQILSFGGVAQLAKVYGNDIVCLGYPTYDGELRTALEPFEVFGILERSTNKKGAWTFLEYYYEHKDITGIPSTTKKFEQAYHDAESFMANDKKTSRDKDKYLETVLKLIDAGRIEKAEYKQIWEILNDELNAIYWQDRNPDDVLPIVQSRVQLYLWEKE